MAGKLETITNIGDMLASANSLLNNLSNLQNSTIPK